MHSMTVHVSRSSPKHIGHWEESGRGGGGGGGGGRGDGRGGVGRKKRETHKQERSELDERIKQEE